MTQDIAKLRDAFECEILRWIANDAPSKTARKAAARALLRALESATREPTPGPWCTQCGQKIAGPATRPEPPPAKKGPRAPEPCQCGAVMLDWFIGTHGTIGWSHTREKCTQDAPASTEGPRPPEEVIEIDEDGRVHGPPEQIAKLRYAPKPERSLWESLHVIADGIVARFGVPDRKITIAGIRKETEALRDIADSLKDDPPEGTVEHRLELAASDMDWIQRRLEAGDRAITVVMLVQELRSIRQAVLTERAARESREQWQYNTTKEHAEEIRDLRERIKLALAIENPDPWKHADAMRRMLQGEP